MFQNDLVSKLKNKIYREYPFFATISYTTEHKFIDNDTILMATDGKVIYVNEKDGKQIW